MRRTVRLPGIALALALTACTSPQESGVKVIVGAKLIAAPGAAPIEYSVVIVDGSRFRAAGPQRSTPVPKGAEMTRGIGMIVEPAPGLFSTKNFWPILPSKYSARIRREISLEPPAA